MKNIAVFFGGKSVEHDISIITALQVMQNLKNYKIFPIYMTANGKFLYGEKLKFAKSYLSFNEKKCLNVTFELGKEEIILYKNKTIKKRIKIDCALLCNHGHGGEDGTLQGLLELSQIPYTSSSVVSSSIVMDKVLTKVILKSSSINTPAYVQFNKCEYKENKISIINKISKSIKFPCIIKPARLGSSVGINICENQKDIESMIENAFIYDDKVLVEKYINKAREFCVAVFKSSSNYMTSKAIEISKGKFYTFDQKYIENKDYQEKEISKKLEVSLKKLAEKSYKCLDCFGIVRVDFLYDEKEDILYVNELNNIPGSLSCNLFDSPFNDILTTIIEEGVDRFNQSNKILYKFNSEAIQKFIDMSDHLKYKFR